MTSRASNGQSTTCVVGAGPSGLATARALLAKGLPVEVFERNDQIGGIWDPTNKGTPIYESAHFISSKTLSGFSGHPFPEGYPDYPRADQILTYLQTFTKKHDLDSVITFSCGVDRAEWSSDGGWTVTLETGDVKQFDNLVCANGTQWHPAMPDIPGSFDGEVFHSKDYSSIDQLRGKRVLIVGAGNSGVDIACDAASSAGYAAISMRRGYHFIPKHIFGIPSDVFGDSGPELPLAISQRVFAVMLRLLNGKQERLGLPKPDHKMFETHPILNSEIFHYLSHGDLQVKRDVESFDGPIVRFTDGTSEEFDVVIFATGYNTLIPYVDEAEFEWTMGRPSMLMRVFDRRNPHLFAVGFSEGDGGGFPIFELMADAVASAIQQIGPATQAAPALWLRFLREADPDIIGHVKLIKVPRHAAYLHGPAYKKEMANIRAEFGWDELTTDD